MGHLLGVIDQARLDEQRGVVQNEKRQGENRPFGRVPETVFRASFPPGHPYRTLPIGSMEDLDAASLDDVRDWFKTYYGAANAVLVLAGDIDVATARAKARAVFRAHRARAGAHAPGRMDRRAHRKPPRDDVRPDRTAALAALLEHAAGRHRRRRIPRPRRRDPRWRQDVATLRTPGLSGPARRHGGRRASRRSRSRVCSAFPPT